MPDAVLSDLASTAMAVLLSFNHAWTRCFFGPWACPSQPLWPITCINEILFVQIFSEVVPMPRGSYCRTNTSKDPISTLAFFHHTPWSFLIFWVALNGTALHVKHSRVQRRSADL
jgi:hypothetical protein